MPIRLAKKGQNYQYVYHVREVRLFAKIQFLFFFVKIYNDNKIMEIVITLHIPGNGNVMALAACIYENWVSFSVYTLFQTCCVCRLVQILFI